MAEQEQLLDILDYWHKIEFFIPFDLKQVLDKADEDDGAVRWIQPDALAPDGPMPWQNVTVPEGRELTGFKLYLGVFDMQRIIDFARALPSDGTSDAVEEEERTTLDGRTCIARVSLSPYGEPVLDPISVSTVPWAIGTAEQAGLGALSAGTFDAARRGLADRLADFASERRQQRTSGGDEAKPLPLTGDELRTLNALLLDWAGCLWPPSSLVALLEINSKERKEHGETASRGTPASGSGPASLSPNKPNGPAKNESGDEDDDDTEEEAQKIDILNSFFIEDIERCIASVREGKVPETVRAYLLPGDPSRRVDLYTDAGRQEIIRALHPAKMNAGHWPEDATRKMSLMQQFAINTAFDRLKDSGLFSVNGPPGTGKTTLLRDMICENIVRRARELARLPSADRAFPVRERVEFADGSHATVGVLRQELTGFEMVVASSNNAAVENISADLPKRKQLGEAWQEIGYLQPVAHKLAAQNSRAKFTRLQPKDVPWGLVSCALGNSKNRRRFVDRVFFDARGSDNRTASDDYQTIWTWRAQYVGPTFDEAKRAFQRADQALQQALDQRKDYAELQAAWSEVTEEAATRTASAALASSSQQVEQANAAAERSQSAHQAADSALADLREEERLLDRAKPGMLSRLFRTAAARQHAGDVARNAGEQIAARKLAARCRAEAAATGSTLRDAQALHARAEQDLHKARTSWREKQDKLAAYREQFPEMRVPGVAETIEADEVQRDGLWQDSALAQLRSGLTVAALALHEAWLAEVLKKGGGFGGNLVALSKMLSGPPLQRPEQALLLWQSLFLMVPVVSSTFASFARQFRGMGPGSIGWLFIDEAGQAVPQAAVGALWRSRRAMVVGDPLQIEPVFTVPSRLIDALAELSAHTSDKRCAPTMTSAQQLADSANPFGTAVPVEGAPPLWIGSPLRVHRRCLDPMFSIANRIAYHGKMVYGLTERMPSSDPLRLGNSAWIDVSGKTASKQVVPEQVEIVAKLVVRLYQASGTLPPLYVISPFKAIKRALQDRLRAIDWQAEAGERAPSKKAWASWCRERIGTVHTFQGKEEYVVVFVLGADHDSAGSAKWAATKPNLLNVAVTRAQNRVFVVGDASLWGDMPYFGEAMAQLGTPIGERQWFDRLGAAVSGSELYA
ncbi:DEAD/DEAH box helicase [Cupriavidus malaysiensis]|uniref:DNA2/NAM7 helicase-like C-terminal domain-containing protein n=1 Tax=Cupriavidus malaysiensis TaxID=367825 RepID=A0ABN4THF9_9BURK|nr:AAA domain-containing protein [Cupriavidus malaysiensis]AOZ04703.1 hypothetical protein BKK80_01755 [Cupriavidus malaysiensis]